MNEIMPHGVSRKGKANEKNTSEIVHVEGREAVEIKQFYFEAMSLGY